MNARPSPLPLQFFAGLETRLADLKAAGKEIFRLDVGSPDLPPPSQVVQRLAQAASRPDTHGYQAHNATPALRQAWADYYHRHYQVELDPAHQVLPLIGSKEGIFHLSLAWLKPGDVALVPDPGYLTYGQSARLAGAEVYPLPLLAENDYLPDLDAIPQGTAHRARLMWLNYPNNPTSAVAPFGFFEKALEFARRYNLLLCHDAAYAMLTFDGHPTPSILQLPGADQVTVEFNTLSKSHNMAGWRTAAALGSPAALKSLYQLKTQADSGYFLPILEAAQAALQVEASWIVARNQIYLRRRDLVLEALRHMGLQPRTPQAGLYIWCPLPEGWQAEPFAGWVLEHASVSLTPGTVFGQHGEGYFRLSLVLPEPRLVQAMQQLSSAMQHLPSAGEFAES